MINPWTHFLIPTGARKQPVRLDYKKGCWLRRLEIFLVAFELFFEVVRGTPQTLIECLISDEEHICPRFASATLGEVNAAAFVLDHYLPNDDALRRP
ncbi:hypothetical protein M0804_004317 [Polistes exclamans]|nr:hypothetical protein M0804_004317 [Polistes exclamans]